MVVEIRGSLFKSTVDLLRDLKWIFSFLCTIMSRVALKMVLYVEKKKLLLNKKPEQSHRWYPHWFGIVDV